MSINESHSSSGYWAKHYSARELLVEPELWEEGIDDWGLDGDELSI
jgi:hypothetical protein